MDSPPPSSCSCLLGILKLHFHKQALFGKFLKSSSGMYVQPTASATVRSYSAICLCSLRCTFKHWSGCTPMPLSDTFTKHTVPRSQERDVSEMLGVSCSSIFVLKEALFSNLLSSDIQKLVFIHESD